MNSVDTTPGPTFVICSCAMRRFELLPLAPDGFLPLYALCYSLCNGWNHVEIAIKLNFWYSEVKFRRMIETDVKEFKIGVESELRKEDHFREVIEKLK